MNCAPPGGVSGTYGTNPHFYPGFFAAHQKLRGIFLQKGNGRFLKEAAPKTFLTLGLRRWNRTGPE
jgi:hypothetical protein